MRMNFIFSVCAWLKRKTCSVLLGVIGLRSNPCVECKRGGVLEGCKCGDAVMAVKNSVTVYLEHQHARGRDLSVKADIVLESLKPMFGFWARIEHGMPVPEIEMLRYRANRLMAAWSEKNARVGHIAPYPPELRDVLDTISEKESVPLGAVGGGELGGERPTDASDNRTEPDVENLVRHGAENLPSSECVHMSPNDPKLIGAAAHG